MTDLLDQRTPEAFHSLVTAILAAPMARSTRERHARKLKAFLEWWDLSGRGQLAPELVSEYLGHLRDQGQPAFALGHSLSAIRMLTRSAAQRRWIDAITLDGILQIKGPKIHPTRLGQWLDKEQMVVLMKQPDRSTLAGKRDRVLLGLLLYCGLRANEPTLVQFEHVQRRDGRPCLVNLSGKGDKRRSVAMPQWLFDDIQEWITASGITSGYIIRALEGHAGVVRSDARLSRQAVWGVVKKYVADKTIFPHDLRRSTGREARKSGVDLDQIRQMYGHSDLRTTLQYIGGTQDLKNAPCDALPSPE